MEVFYYSKPEYWRNDPFDRKDRERIAISPGRSLGLVNPEAVGLKGILAVPVQAVDNWLNNPKFPAARSWLENNVGNMAIGVDTTELWDLSVVDWAHMAGYLRPVSSTPRTYRHENRSDAEGALARTARHPTLIDDLPGQFTLPLVVIWEELSYNQLQPTASQPFLENQLLRMEARGCSKDETLAGWKDVPALAKWLTAKGYPVSQKITPEVPVTLVHPRLQLIRGGLGGIAVPAR